MSKITPTKAGQFVTFWKRKGKGSIEPFSSRDSIDLLIVSARKGKKFGQFIFPKSALCKHDIIADKGKPGKRGFRVYPPWDTTTSRQAIKTQDWQVEYFLDMPEGGPVDLTRSRMLYLPDGML